jgi:hypothetical protein
LCFYILEKQLANILDRGFLFLRNTHFYSTLLAITDRQKDRRRVKYAHCAWAGETLFPVVCVSFWFWREIGFGLHSYVLRVQYSCGVVLFFWFWQEIVFGVTYVLGVQYSCAAVSVFWLWREIDLKM